MEIQNSQLADVPKSLKVLLDLQNIITVAKYVIFNDKLNSLKNLTAR
ncbi:MAG: hypothetical protein AAF348_09270 [Bacteroidota bacterium]